MRIYNRNKRSAFRAHNVNCADGFKEDRKFGLIYSSYQEDDGSILSVEQASIAWGFCAYCGINSMEEAA